MATYVPPKINTAYVFYISLVSQANTKIFQVNPTLAAADFNVATDDGAPAALGTTPVIDADFTRRVKVTLSAAEMNGGNVTFIASDNAGAEWCDLTINIQTVATQIDGLATPTNITAGTITTVTNLTNAPTAGDLTATMKTSVTTAVPTAAVNAAAVWDLDATAHQTQGTFGQAIGDPVADTNTIYKAVVTDAAGATVGVDVVAVKAETASIQTDTNDLQTQVGTAGAGLTNINLPNQTMDIIGNITGNLSGSVGTLTGTVVLADASSDAVIADAVWNAATVTYGAAGSYGLLIETDLDATISSRLATAGYTAPTNLTAAQIATGVWTDATAGDFTAALSVGKSVMNGVALGTGLTIAAVSGAVGSVTGAVGSVTGAVGSVTGAVGSVTGLTASDVGAIKTTTDKFVFTVANEVNANIQSINDVTIVGNGGVTPFNV